ncbi:uncharacterized protein DUF4360 [Actinomadura pelletieri DSM 43383]|uniref:Uncharacterized protein DUF4360 n=1 Tax=Actinomadura pelletieri DSM 43383 TaxID=1120940 RepID=A0A495QYV5_9ACTN|nr:uncharacterized protein DUF4360 [Actinomadura pelletieri DSM 43383]
MASVVPAAAGARLVRGPDGAKVEVVSVNGSGCPAGTVNAYLTQDTNQIRLGYSDFAARTGPDSNLPDLRRNCQVSLKMHMPEGFTYGIVSASHLGYALIQEGANAVVKVEYSFRGTPSPFRHTVNGPIDDIWWFPVPPPIDSPTWKPCDEDRPLRINSELRIHPGTSDPSKVNFISMDSLEEGPHHVYALAWKTCP